MYTDKKDPIPGLSYAPADIFKGLQEYHQQVYNADHEASLREASIAQREKDEAGKYYADYVNEAYKNDYDRSTYLQNIKTAFVSECLYKLFRESCNVMTDMDKIVAKNLVGRFVKDNGAWNLINEFGTKNLILSEFARICEKYYNKVLEGTDCSGCDNLETDELGFLIGRPLKLDNTIGSEFFEELEDVDCSDACKLIRDRVSDSVTEFIDSNLANKLEYEEVINAAKDQIDAATNESFAEDISARAHRDIIERENSKERNVFHCLVESLTTSVFKDDNLKTRYINESGVVNMDGLVNSATLMYTMLEMVNTMNIVHVDEEFINDYLKSIGVK